MTVNDTGSGTKPPLGPFQTEAEARATPAVRAVYAAFDADPGAGKMAPHSLAMLRQACDAAGVELGAYDSRILAWLAGFEPQACAVIAGLIGRAHQGAAGVTAADLPVIQEALADAAAYAYERLRRRLATGTEAKLCRSTRAPSAR